MAGVSSGRAAEERRSADDNDNDNNDEDDEDRLVVDGDYASRFRDICQRLNVDEDAYDRALRLYESVAPDYVLPGDPLHWIGLALYVGCRTSAVPTVGRADDVLESNCVSLTKLLKLCNLSLAGFFDKIKNWSEMLSLSDDFRRKIDKLERNFYVSAVLYKELKSVFYEIFLPTEPGDAPKPSKSNKKAKLTPCTSASLFEFTWCLFICVKGEFSALSDDLVNMYHIFLCCVDFVFANAYAAQRKDIIDPKFEALPSGWSSPKFKASGPAPCIISPLCRKYHGLEVEARNMKSYKFKNAVENFFQKNFLKGDSETLTGLVDPSNFNFNLKSLNNMYGTFMLRAGEFDERIILDDNESELKITNDEIFKAIKLYEVNKKNTFYLNTPLTGREHLNHKNDPLTPTSTAYQSLEKLKTFIAGRSNAPSQNLVNMFKECTENPMQPIMMRQKALAALFLVNYSRATSEETADKKLSLIEILYYRLLEDLVKEERRRKPHLKPQWLFENDTFHKVLFACCTEMIIMYSAHANSATRFPWVLECYYLDAFNFYKIIEMIVITVKERLSRDVVKHLNAIEEHVLESLAWKSKSQLWVNIEQLGESIPCWADVRIESSPNITKDRNKKVQPVAVSGVVQPSNPTFQDRFLSPVPDSVAKKQLFKDDAIKPGQSLLNQNNTPGEDETSTSAPPAPVETPAITSPKKTVKGSFGLFFRKFYSLACIRLQNLCLNLRLDDDNLISKIWTLFEYCIRQHIHLMKDRHLDQILMCTIYAMCKVCNNSVNNVEKSFREIMRCYKLQPQADSRVYRDVLLSSVPEEDDDNENKSPTSAQNKTNTRQKRGDLITFYNNVYIVPMQDLVFRISGKTNTNQELCLSPLPEIRRGNGPLSMESHRVSDHHHLYVHSLDTPVLNDSLPYTYRFNRFSAKDLHDINMLMAQEAFIGTKRIIQESDGPSAKKILNSLRKCLQ